jgi:hypothetical protein
MVSLAAEFATREQAVYRSFAVISLVLKETEEDAVDLRGQSSIGQRP